eukprot:COSAG02_NODE_812_length_16908_cov_238.494319_5_plen_122_part_00
MHTVLCEKCYSDRNPTIRILDLVVAYLPPNRAYCARLRVSIFHWFFICVQSVSEFLWDGLRASIEFPFMPKHAQYARFGGDYPTAAGAGASLPAAACATVCALCSTDARRLLACVRACVRA